MKIRNLFMLLLLSFAVPTVAFADPKSDAAVVAMDTNATTTNSVDTPTSAPTVPEDAAATATVSQDDLSWWKVGLKHGLELVFLILSIMATALVRVMMKKYGFEEQSGKVNDVLMKATGFAEQWSIKKMKMDSEPRPGGAKKMEVAIDFAKKLAVEYKLPDKGSDWWENKLEGWLGVDKAKAAAAKSS